MMRGGGIESPGGKAEGREGNAENCALSDSSRIWAVEMTLLKMLESEGTELEKCILNASKVEN
jgi:hypothetical protein